MEPFEELENTRFFSNPEQLFSRSEKNYINDIHNMSLAMLCQKLSLKRPHGVRPWLGLKLTSLESLAHILALLQSAVQAETNGQHHRADFYWTEILNNLSRLKHKEKFWLDTNAIFSEMLNIEKLVCAKDFQMIFLRELIIDTLCGLYNGSINVETSESNDRTSQYVKWMEQFSKQIELSEREQESIFRGPFLFCINENAVNKRWKPAIAHCENALKFFSKSYEFQNHYSELIYSEIITELNKEETVSQSKGWETESEAKSLQCAINKLELFREIYPGNALNFEYLGILHHLKAIKLGNAGQFSKALLEVEKAAMNFPDLKQVYDTRKQLFETLDDLSVQLRNLLSQIKNNPQLTLTNEQKRLKKEIELGDTLRQKFLNSEEPNQIAQGLRRAHAETLWNRIGLGDTFDSTGTTAISVLQTMEEVTSSSPTSITEIRQLWEDKLSSISLAKPIDSEKVINFLSSHILDTVILPSDSSNNLKTSQLNPYLSFCSTQTPPRIDTPKQHQPNDSEPVKEWLFSRQSLRLKLQCIVSVLILLTAGGLWSFDSWARYVRDNAYTTITAIETKNDLSALIKASELFFSVNPIANDSEREKMIQEIYSRSLIHWLLQNDDNSNLELLERYRQVRENFSAEPIGDKL